MIRTTCQYAIVRFLPFVETGEFANVGVVLLAPNLPYFDFRLEGKKTGRVTKFFTELDAKLYRAALRDFGGELERIRSLVNTQNHPDLQHTKFARNLFVELTRDRGNLIQFSKIRAVMTAQVEAEADRLFQYYVERNFAPSDQREKQLERRLRGILRSAKLADRFRPRDLGTEDFLVPFPFVECSGEKYIKAIRPIELAQDQPKKILERAAIWEFRINRLRSLGALPEHVLFATAGPDASNHRLGGAFREAQDMLDGPEITVVPIKNREALIEFARAA